jgi:hypothetical protein
MMNEKLDWTQKLGDAFLAQQADVMSAIQRLRSKAQAQGNLKTTNEQNVIVEPLPVSQTTETQEVIVEPPAPGQTTIIRIEPANPQVVYVPTYNPTVVYGAWPYPAYPPYAYYPPGFVAGRSGLASPWALHYGGTAIGGMETSTSTSTTTITLTGPISPAAPGSIALSTGKVCNIAIQ